MEIEGDLVGAAATSKLHGDLMVQMLVRLPIKSIIRFKSVCRAWHVLFSSPIFTHQHSRMIGSFAKTTNLSSLLVHTPWPPARNADIFSRGRPPCPTGRNAHIFSILLDHPCGNPVMMDLNPPLEGDLEHVEVVGSINGLVCLNLCRSATSIVLWNPAIRKRSTLPNPRLFVRIEGRVLVGFAYDETNDSYKVIRIVYARSRLADAPVMVEIYNTVTNSWRTIEGVSFPLLRRGFVDAVRGVPYWFGMGDESNHFVWFDASAEDFRVHPLAPDDNYSLGIGVYVGLKILGQHLVLMYYAKRKVPKVKVWKVTRLEIRKLRKCGDGGGKDPFSIEDKLTVVPVPHLHRILGFWRNGEIIALDQENALVTYDFDSTQVQYLPSHHTIGNRCCPKVYDYMESLVWPTSLG